MTPNDVKIVADNIDDFIEVPNGVARLRKAVLTLAVSGKLVPQIPKEGTAKEFYEQIQIERLRAVKELVHQKKYNDKSEEITKEEEPFTIPSSWGWVRFQETFFSVRGITFPGGDKSKKLEEGYIPVLRSGNVQDVLDLSNLLYVPEKHVRNKNQYLQEGDIVVSMANSRELVGKSCLAVNLKGKYSFGGFLSVFRPYLISPEYFQIVFSSDFARARFFKDAKQVTNIANLSLATINLIPFPLPPLAEQKRIVKKVEEVMKQLDELEAKKREQDEVRTRLVRSAMQSLGKGESKIAFEQLPELIKTPSDIKELENALLTLAVSGKLVAQDKKDTAVESEKATTEYGKEFNIPQSWAWFQLNDVCTFKYGYTDSAKEIGTARFVRITDMGSDGNLIPNDQRYVDLSPESKKYLLSEGDLLTARIGATFGRTIIFREKYKAVFASYLIRMGFEKDFILPEYYWVFSQSGLYWNQAHSLVSGSAQPQFNANLIKKIYLPVPPLAEQKRIVKKVEEIMSFVNKLREHVLA